MGIDVSIGPDSDFTKWSEKKLNRYLEKHETEFDGEKLGSSSSILDTLGTIEVHLCNGSLKSKYPIFSKMDSQEFIGWIHDDLNALQVELKDIADKLKLIDYKKQISVMFDMENQTVNSIQYTEKEIEQIENSFLIFYPGKVLETLYDLNHWFLDTLILYVDKGLDAKKGLLVG